MSKHDIIVIGASAGGVEALSELVEHLDENIQAAVFVVLHTSPHYPSHLPDILNKSGRLKAIHPKDGSDFQYGGIYIAPPDYHLLLEKDKVLIKKGPKENRFRPSIDALFRSAAYVYGHRVIGVVLSGMLDDGTSGLWTIKRLGGITVIQDPEKAQFPSMAINVLDHVKVDYKESVPEMAALLNKLTKKSVPEKPSVTAKEMDLLKMDVVIASGGKALEMGIMEQGKLSTFTCPECHGALVGFKEGKIIRFRCHTGHAYSLDSLLSGVTDSIEKMLYQTLRGMEEVNMILKAMEKIYKESGNKKTANIITRKLKRIDENSERVRRMISEQENLSEEKLEA
jgi:two-component system chemotaxis response regulator CheB